MKKYTVEGEGCQSQLIFVFYYYMTLVHNLFWLAYKQFCLIIHNIKIDHYLLTPWSRVLLEKLTSKLCS